MTLGTREYWLLSLNAVNNTVVTASQIFKPDAVSTTSHVEMKVVLKHQSTMQVHYKFQITGHVIINEYACKGFHLLSQKVLISPDETLIDEALCTTLTNSGPGQFGGPVTHSNYLISSEPHQEYQLLIVQTDFIKQFSKSDAFDSYEKHQIMNVQNLLMLNMVEAPGEEEYSIF
jgi:hypothetical protein